VLWYLTVGSVRGFAFFLGISALTDILITYFFTRSAVLLFARSKRVQGRMVLGIQTVKPEGM
jgi:preprotein translocase subunit SecD